MSSVELKSTNFQPLAEVRITSRPLADGSGRTGGGFNSKTVFNTYFKKTRAMTPKEFLKKNG
ncbi:hypothetical protein [uncultured Draconibacterium sp.]|uniref:hypothetical protein n=1 Tax=uncultured Draconibacterium sp. TaxID=1573823 RepID=UPI0029C788DD|nr:hypothetical protein [uncultured Draconibacterium sp.]